MRSGGCSPGLRGVLSPSGKQLSGKGLSGKGAGIHQCWPWLMLSVVGLGGRIVMGDFYVVPSILTAQASYLLGVGGIQSALI